MSGTFLQEVLRRPCADCVVGQTVDSLGDDADEVEEALQDARCTSTAIARVMGDKGHTRPDGKPLSDQQIRRHRTGLCCCE